MASQLLSLKDIRLTFGGTPLLEGADLSVQDGDRICLVGRNGSGKSTLMKIAAGLAECDSGERFVHPNSRVRYLPQDADFAGFGTVLDYVEAGLDPFDKPHMARKAIEDLSLDPYADPNSLSGGEARRAALARVLAPRPDVLLLDEPTNHLDLPAIEWLEKKLNSLRCAIVLISHDRRLLETLSKSTLWLDRGQTRNLSSGFSEFEAWRDKVLEEEAAERHKLGRKIEREEQWMYSGGVTGRRKRNMRRVAEMYELRQQQKDARKVVGNVKMTASEADKSGKLVMEATGLTKDYGAGPVVDGLTIRVGRGDRLGVVGPNGAGKTTLLNMLTGVLAPDSGTIKLGTNLEIVMLDQRREALDPETRVADILTGGGRDWIEVNGLKKHVSSYLADFLFQPEQSRSPVKVLSGGEKARLLLARAMAKPSNLLILDEPTNDLDLETLDLLQELLCEYSGTILLVSHDRDFLDRVVTSVIASDGDGHWTEYAGGYSDMLAQRGGADLASDTRRTLSVASNEGGGGAGLSASGMGSDPATGRRKMTFKDKHALATLPATITRLETEIKQLTGKANDNALLAKNPAAFNAAIARLGKVQAELTAAEEQWLDLELRREQLGS